ncbi:MAG: 1-acyl-sn-glycerol-3-phosphate acyltransferase [Saprospiraceae bacterium]|nr:1-acyl-sn-glycerol-3-phosphate acyltransferase [Saprospiraceae bacterium]
MMTLHRKLWAIYGILVFFLLWLVLIPFYYLAFLLFPRPWVRYIIWFSHHVYTRLYFGLTLVRFKIEGLENIDLKQPYIIVSNHLTALDFMINARAYPSVYKFLAKKELVKVPLFGFIVRKLCVLVDRSSASSRSSSMKYLHRTLEEGYSVFVYPEGTRNTTADPLLPFHKGAFRIAIESGKPIAIQTLIGVKKISNQAAGLDLWPGTVRIVWSKPIETAGLTMADVDDLSDRVRRAILEKLGN